MRSVDIVKCVDALHEATEWTVAGQGLDKDGIVQQACTRVVNEINEPTGPVIPPLPRELPTREEEE